MAKSKCDLCGKLLKGGDWQLRKSDDGKVLKICIDRKECQKRIREKKV